MTATVADVEAGTESGPVRGIDSAGVAEFRGIPYATARRFAAPEPVLPWTATRDARVAGPAAPQGTSMLAPILGTEPMTTAEDGCLSLNIFSPGLAGRRPVLFWLHGGAFVTGYAGGPRQSGGAMAAHNDIVVVTANYRLGPLGYHFVDGGNFGLLDQIAALQWVHRNIAEFGGDPECISVAGHSAGALSAAAVAVSPEAAGIVRRAVLLSPQLNSVTTPDRASTEAQSLADRVGGDIRDVPAEHLVRAAHELAAERGPAGAAPSLVVGGAGLPRDIEAALADSNLGLLLGTARDEARAFLHCDPGARSVDRTMAMGLLGRHFPDRAEQAYQHYAARRPGAAPAEVATDALTDALFRQPVLGLAEARNAYLYQFDWQPTPQFGACHTVDLPFALGNPAAWTDAPLLAGMAVDPLEPLAGAYSGALAEFVRTGTASWEQYEPTRRTTMRFDWVLGPVGDLAGPERHLWAG